MFTLNQAGYSCKWVNDSQRLLLEWFDAIYDSPSQLYHLALPFCPPSSWLYKCYAVEFSQEVRVIKGLPAEWGMCSRTVTLNYSPLAVTCWKDTIAVSLESGDIIILDGNTGGQTAVLSQHTGWLRSLAFSPDGTILVSGSDDRTVKLWDVQTGGAIKIFHGHTDWVLSVSISADCAMIASGSSDKTIRLWNIQTEECHHIIKQYDSVFRVWFSPINPQHFISASGGKIQQWDTNGHQINPTYNGSYIAISLDGTQFVLCHGEAIEVRNSDSGEIVTKFHMATGGLHHCCFSPNGRLIAAASNSIAYIWDITSSDPHPIKTFIGHTELITSLVFSSSASLISSSLGHSVKFWQTSALSTDTVVTVPEPTPITSAPIKSITLQAKDGVVISRDSDGVVRTWEISTGLCKAVFQTPAKNYCLGDVRLINTRLIFAWEEGMKIHIWDVEKGELQTVNSTWGIIYDVRISEDGTKVFGLYSETIQSWSILTGEVVGEVQHEISQRQKFLAVDGSRVWVNSPLLEPLGWDFGVSDSPILLSNTTLHLPNNTKLWDIGQSRIKDTVTGKVVFQLAGRFAEPSGSQWDGQYLAAGYDSGEVLILNFNHMFFK